MPPRPLPTELLESPGYQMWLATNAWQRMVRTGLEPLGVTHAQFAVLSSVARLCGVGDIEAMNEGEPVTQTDVSRFASLDPNMASQLVRGLEARGLLSRLPHPTDRRAFRLELTPEGEALFHRGKAVIRPLAEAFFAPLGEERRELARMLGLINRAVGCPLAEESRVAPSEES